VKLSSSCCGTSVKTHRTKNQLDARVSQAEIGQVYDRLSRFYDVWGKLTESRARDRAIDLAAIKDGETILEVAVGTGLAFHEIVKKNPHGRNVGIDISPGMLEKAKRRLKTLPQANYSLALGDAFNLREPTESVDVLVNNYMFDLIPHRDMDKILLEFRRVLKKDGRLVLVDMTRGRTAAAKLYELIYRIRPAALGGCRGVELSDSLNRLGFTVEIREYHQQMLFPSEVILARKKA